ncbi:MAG: GTPase [Pseudomonadota bacterium]
MSQFQTLWQRVFSPKVDEATLEEKLGEIRQALPVPVFWLLGKTQSGKTSLIRALTGRDDAEIGNGFQPCTQTARQYDFPNAESCFIRFLDTRGLGEVDYDPTEDMQLFSKSSHVLIVVMKAMDHAQENIIQALQAIRKSRPNWPIIVLQTTLHEGYPTREMEHIEPYPYAESPLPASVPKDLTRSLIAQRELFKDLNAHFVPVDFTLPEDEYSPENYGLEALWTAIETALPLGLRSVMQDSLKQQEYYDVYSNTAHPHIIAYAGLAASAAALPVPMVGTPLVLSIQGKMLQTIASIYDQPMDRKRLTEIVSALGLGFLLNMGGRELTKFVPVFGSAVASAYTGAVTYALGRTLCVYFSLRGETPDKALFEKIYQEELEKGKALLQEYFKPR